MTYFEFKTEDGENSRTVFFYGTLNKVTYSAYEDQLLKTTEGVSTLILDMSELENISSAGLRLLLKMHLEMEKKEGMKIRGVKDYILEIFDITGFSSFLCIEKD